MRLQQRCRYPVNGAVKSASEFDVDDGKRDGDAEPTHQHRIEAAIARVVILILIAAELENIEEHVIGGADKIKAACIRGHFVADLRRYVFNPEERGVDVEARKLDAGQLKRRNVECDAGTFVAQSIEQALHPH